MKFGALALDYDGTVAVDGSFDPSVRDAIGEVRARGIVAALVTGRRLPDLARAAGDLSCFDVVVGENGAVLQFPASGRYVRLGPSCPPPARTHGSNLASRHTSPPDPCAPPFVPSK